MKNIDIEAGRVSGRFMIEKILPGGERVVAADWFENLVTDNGLNLLGSTSASELTGACGAGAGTTPPANGDSALQSPIGTRTPNVTMTTGPTSTPVDHTWMRKTYTFAIGQVVGNVAELGTFSSTSGGTMFSRALVKDTLGNPTTITVRADEQLVVTYELRKYPPLTDQSGTISITVDGVPTDYNYTIRTANFNNSAHQGPYYWSAAAGFASTLLYAVAFETDALAGVTGYPSGADSASTTNAVSAYTNGTFFRDVAHAWAIGSANFPSGVGSVAFGVLYGIVTYAGYQISFTPKLPKNSSRTLTLPFRLSWGRYAP